MPAPDILHAPTMAGTYTYSRPPAGTMDGIVIGLLSSLGSAIFIILVFLVVYFFRYTASGRIFLDRIGRPGEYDDEQAFAREEAEALQSMDDMQRTEYLRAKGMKWILLAPFSTVPGIYLPYRGAARADCFPQLSSPPTRPSLFKPTSRYRNT